LSPNETYSQHVVTAVIVAHDGAAWLPRVIESLLDQSRPVQRVVAVDTGSRDRSGSVLADLLGRSVVFGMDRVTGYGEAVTRALQHRAANVNVPGSAGVPGAERAEWVWLLHDDCEPAPDALEQLLRGAAETRSAAVLGPKVKDWADRQVILEAGITIDTAGRRITGVEPREVDQGQHDGDRDCLAVSSAGMLIRRDVWDSVGGFDTGMALFREDVDFCWRVHSAGYRVRVITDAVVYHVEASARRRRPISVARRPRQLDRRNAMLTLIGNLPALPMLASAVGNLTISALRALYFLLAKRVTAGLDELAAVGSVFGHPFRLLALRRRRALGRRAAYARVRTDLPPGRSVRRAMEFAASAFSRSGPADTAGSHHATDDPDAEADFLLTDTGLAQRVLTNPGVLLFLGLTVVSLVAERSLIGLRPLGGGALVPAWGGAAALWHEYLQGFHPVGIGSGDSAPPYLAVVAALATVLGGKPWLAVDVILLGCVPLAGVTAFLAARRVTRSTPVRVWAAATYALLPVATGTIAAGRIGTAVVFVLLPVIALQAGRMLTEPARRARRAAWATGLTVAVAAAFVPLVWIVAFAAALALIAVRPAMWRNLAIVALVPPVLLLPWTVHVASNPSGLLLEAGLQQPGLAVHDLSARSVMLLSPGGPGLPSIWVTAGLLVAALAALLVGKRRGLMLAGWGVALAGLAIALAVSRVMITPVAGEPAVSAWPGAALLIAAMGLLLAGAIVGETLLRRDRLDAETPEGGQKGGRVGLRGIGVAALAAVACSTPVFAAVSWVTGGVRGPVAPASGPVVPAVVTAAPDSGLQLRTLVLRSDGSQVSYSLQRGTSPSLGDPDLAPVPAAQAALNTAVATLVAPNGGEAEDQSQQLAQFDIGFVLLPAPVNQSLARQLNGIAGLQPLSATPAFDVWRLSALTARVRVVEPNGTVVAMPSGTVGLSGGSAPAAGGTLELAEPAGGWEATLNGKPLTQVTSPAGSWAQAFRLPPGGGVLTISHNQTARDLILVLELVAVAVVAALALPGSRTSAEESAPAAAAADGARPAGEAAGGDPAAGRRARGHGGRAARTPRRDRDTTSSPRRDRRDRRGRPAARRRPAVAETSPGNGPAPSRTAWPEGEPAAGAPAPRAAWPGDDPAGARAPWPEGGDAADAGTAWPADDAAVGAAASWSGAEAAGAVSWPEDDAPARGGSWPDDYAPGAGASWPEDEPAASAAAWPADDAAAGAAAASWPGDDAPGHDGAWPEDEPAATGASWPDDRQAGSAWPAEPAAGAPDPGAPWPSGERGSWPAPEPSDWPAVSGDTLDPLPPAGRSRHRRPGPPRDDEPARWPVPEHDSGGDAW
jgi:GT2 family glycosyltransferase